MTRNGEAVWCIDCSAQCYESTIRGNIIDLTDSMRVLQEGHMQELKEDRKTLIENIEMMACTSKEMPEDG